MRDCAPPPSARQALHQRALGHDGLVRLIGHARRALRLVEKIGKFGPCALEARCVDIGNIAGNHFQIKLLGVHACGG